MVLDIKKKKNRQDVTVVSRKWKTHEEAHNLSSSLIEGIYPIVTGMKDQSFLKRLEFMPLILKEESECYWTKVQLLTTEKPIIERQVWVKRKSTLIRKVVVQGEGELMSWTNSEDPAQSWQFLKGNGKRISGIISESWFSAHHFPLHADRLTLFECYLAHVICLQHC